MEVDKDNRREDSPKRNPQMNPRKAVTKLKQSLMNVQVMKHRFKVLKVQNEYNHYKAQDHQLRLKRHSERHQTIERDRTQLRKSLDALDHTQDLKLQSQRLRKQIKERIQEARKNHREQRIQDYHLIKDQSICNQQNISKFKKSIQQMNQQRKNQVVQSQQKQKLNVSRFRQVRVRETLQSKELEAGYFLRKAQKKQKELNKMMAEEQQLLKQNMQSLQASQIMRSKYTSVFAMKEGELPAIKARTINSKQTNSSKLTNHSGKISQIVVI